MNVGACVMGANVGVTGVPVGAFVGDDEGGACGVLATGTRLRLSYPSSATLWKPLTKESKNCASSSANKRMNSIVGS